jgi:hypothetical protein
MLEKSRAGAWDGSALRVWQITQSPETAFPDDAGIRR